MTRFSLPLKTLQSITETLSEADALLTDGDNLQKLLTEYGKADPTYLWAQQTRALLKKIKTDIKPCHANPNQQ